MSCDSKIRVAFVTQWFPPENVGPPLWIADALRGRGFNLGVVTGVPHYPTGVPVAGYRATGWGVEHIGGFPVLRVPEFPSHDSSTLRRMATFASFAVSGAALGVASIGRGDVALVYSSPATAALPALVARVRHGTPYVLLVQDLWPDSVMATGFLSGGQVRRPIEFGAGVFVDASYRLASHICVISSGMRGALIDRGVPDDKVSVIYNWVDESVLSPATAQGELRRRLGLSQTAFVALYAGNLGEAQGLAAWVRAMAMVEDLHDVHLVFLGQGTQGAQLRALAANAGMRNRVHFIDSVPTRQMPPITADADVSIVSLSDRPLFRITMPSKVQAAFAMSSPVIASTAGDAAAAVLDAGAGWVAAPEDPESIAMALRAAHSTTAAARRSMGEAGRRYYEAYMGSAVGAARLARVLRVAAADVNGVRPLEAPPASGMIVSRGRVGHG